MKKQILLFAMICMCDAQWTPDCQLGLTENMPCIGDSACTEGFICDHQGSGETLFILTDFMKESEDQILGTCVPFVALGLEPEKQKEKPSRVHYYYRQLNSQL